MKTFLLIVALLIIFGSCKSEEEFEWELWYKYAKHKRNMELCEEIKRDAEGLGIVFQAHKDNQDWGEQAYKDALFELAQLYITNCDTIQVHVPTPEQIDSIEDSLLARIEADLEDCEEFKTWLESQEDTAGTD